MSWRELSESPFSFEVLLLLSSNFFLYVIYFVSLVYLFLFGFQFVLSSRLLYLVVNVSFSETFSLSHAFDDI